MTLDLTKCVRGQKLRYRDGTIGTFIAYVPEAVESSQIVSFSDGSYKFNSPDGGYTIGENPHDIIGLVETIAYPELWVVRWPTGYAHTFNDKPAGIGINAIITHLPAAEREK